MVICLNEINQTVFFHSLIMKCVEWLDEFNLGIHVIDEQHKQLIALMNRICNALNEGKGDEIVEQVLQDMQVYAMTHFTLEEKYFDEFHYEKAAIHKAWHETFNKKVMELTQDIKNDREGVSVDAIAFLGGWFIDHTQTLDREYVALFHEHGLN